MIPWIKSKIQSQYLAESAMSAKLRSEDVTERASATTKTGLNMKDSGSTITTMEKEYTLVLPAKSNWESGN